MPLSYRGQKTCCLCHVSCIMRCRYLLFKSKWDVDTEHLINIHVRQWGVATKYHSNNHPFSNPRQKSSLCREKRQCQNPPVFRHNLHGQDEQLLDLGWRVNRVEHCFCLTLAHHRSPRLIFLHTSLSSFPCEGTGLVWHGLTATTSRVTLLHHHTEWNVLFLHIAVQCQAAAHSLVI